MSANLLRHRSHFVSLLSNIGSYEQRTETTVFVLHYRFRVKVNAQESSVGCFNARNMHRLEAVAALLTFAKAVEGLVRRTAITSW